MKVTNLELSKKLKEAGFPQIRHGFYWMRLVNLPEWDKLDPYYCEYYTEEEEPEENPNDYKGCKIIALAPTAEEILDFFPNFMINKDKQKYTLYLGHQISKSNWRSDNLIDAAAKMWLYLKEHGLL